MRMVKEAKQCIQVVQRRRSMLVNARKSFAKANVQPFLQPGLTRKNWKLPTKESAFLGQAFRLCGLRSNPAHQAGTESLKPIHQGLIFGSQQYSVLPSFRRRTHGTCMRPVRSALLGLVSPVEALHSPQRSHLSFLTSCGQLDVLMSLSLTGLRHELQNQRFAIIPDSYVLSRKSQRGA